MKNKLFDELVALLGSHKELGLSETEIRLVSSVMSGYALSPKAVRMVTALKLHEVARAALEFMGAVEKGRENGGLSN